MPHRLAAMGIPHWAEVILLLLGAMLVLGVVASLVSETLMRRWRSTVERRRQLLKRRRKQPRP